MDSFALAQQSKPRPGGVSVNDLIIKDLQDRREAGIRKYGQEVLTHNGRDPLIDLYQEQIDALVYTRQLLEERRSDGDVVKSLIDLSDCLTVAVLAGKPPEQRDLDSLAEIISKLSCPAS